MNRDKQLRAQQIFGEAMDRAAADRPALIASACGDDAELRTEVESLVASIQEAGGFLASPTAGGAQELATVALQQSAVPLTERPGARIGRYKLLQLIGEGGFGSVFMSEQVTPVVRKVALKIIKLGMDTKQVIARFEAERQALAMMDHPNIARVLDAGATDTGRPYFVMELVRGVPITDYCDQNKLTTRQRLELFVQVCQAVQHAHTKGIIHRDLKPNNVLVTLHDGTPVPKVIDFGIAKATSARLTERTLFTEFRQFIGTPQYMSPEQATMSGMDVDTRSDVYALGVLLYELLTGTTPFDPGELRGAAYERIGQIIREVEPPRPSTRLSTLGETLTSVAAHRGTDPRRLAQGMRGELDWIAMKCLEKDRTRRYESASALAADVRRHLDDEPVQARPPTAMYRMAKLVRRHKAGAAATFVAIAGLGAGLAAATYGLRRAMQERNQAIASRVDEAAQRRAAEAATALAEQQRAAAVRNEAQARLAAAKAEAISRFLQEMLSAGRPEQAMGKVVLARDVIDRAAARLDAGTLKGQPEVEAAARQTLGRSYWSLGEYAKSEAQFRKALDLARKSSGGQSPLVASILAGLADAVGWRGDRAGAVPIAREALAMRLKLDGTSCVCTAEAMENLAMDLSHIGAAGEAESLARQAMAIRQRLGEKETAGLAFDLVLIGEEMRGDPAAREDLLRRGLAMQRKVLGDQHPDVAHTLHNLGAILLAEGKLTEARTALNESLAIKRKILGPDHPDMGSSLQLLWHVLVELRDWRDLEPVLLERYAWMRKRKPDTPPIDEIQNLVRVYGVLGKPDLAAKWQAQLQAALAQEQERLSGQVKRKPADPEAVEDLAWFEARFGRFRQAADDYAKAITLDPNQHWNWYYRGCLLAYLGDEREYRALCDAMLKRFAGSNDPSILDRTAKTCLLLPGVPGTTGDVPDPLELSSRALRQAGNDANLRAWFSLCQGMALYRHGDFQASTAPLRAALEPADVTRHAMATLFLAMASQRLGNPEAARAGLADATREMDQNLPKATDGELSGFGVENWLMCQVARREAEATIVRQPAPTLP